MRERPTSDLAGRDAQEEVAERCLLAGGRLNAYCVPVSQSQKVAVIVQHGLAPCWQTYVTSRIQRWSVSQRYESGYERVLTPEVTAAAIADGVRSSLR
jgi:hypothetical protein